MAVTRKLGSFSAEAVVQDSRQGEEEKIMSTLKMIKQLKNPLRLVREGQKLWGKPLSDEMEYRPRLEVAKNKNTPTAYLLYLYRYVNQHVTDPLGRIPGPRQPPAFVTQEIRDAAFAQLVKRDFDLDSYEESVLDERVKKLLYGQLDAERVKYFRTSLKLKKTALNSVVAELLRAQADEET